MIGATLSPIDSYLLQRGLKTLHLRIERSEANAKKLAERCKVSSAIDEVLYSGKTGMLSLRLNKDFSVAKFLENLEICIFAESLGGTETFITFPYTQTHVDMPDEEKDKRGIDEHLIRLSIGIEDYNDIESDILRALENSKVGVIYEHQKKPVIFDEHREGVDYDSANPPLYDSSTFHQRCLVAMQNLIMPSGNPNRQLLEEKLAKLEGGQYAFITNIKSK